MSHIDNMIISPNLLSIYYQLQNQTQTEFRGVINILSSPTTTTKYNLKF